MQSGEDLPKTMLSLSPKTDDNDDDDGEGKEDPEGKDDKQWRGR